MSIGRQCQTKVADILRTVDGLAQTPQQYRFNQVTVRTLADLIDQLLIMLGLRLITSAL